MPTDNMPPQSRNSPIDAYALYCEAFRKECGFKGEVELSPAALAVFADKLLEERQSGKSDRCQKCPWPKDGCIYPKCGEVPREVLEKALLKAALDLFGCTSAAAFKVQVPNTTPPLFLMCGEEAHLKAFLSEKQAPITDNDRRWRFLEHGCEWVSFIPIGGEQRSFDPRVVTDSPGVGVVAMRVCVDRWTEKHLAILREGINAAKR